MIISGKNWEWGWDHVIMESGTTQCEKPVIRHSHLYAANKYD